MKITVVYDPINGTATADGKADELVNSILSARRSCTVVTSNALVIDYFRLAVTKKVIENTELVFEFEGKTLPVAKSGRLACDWPVGFCDYSDEVLCGILYWKE